MTDSTKILEILSNSPSVALLRARQCSMILEFLTGVLDETSAISQENLYTQLAEFLNEKGIDVDEDNNVYLSDTFEEKAEKYVKRWIDSGFLTNYTNDDGEIYYQLSAHTSKVFEWVSGLKREEYIGTESKFKSIITQLKDLVENTNSDKEKRLQYLEAQKLEIEQKIQHLQIGEDVEVFEEYQIVPRFQQINKLAKELLSDFKDVDDNFKTIIKEIYQKQIDPSLNKGEILQYTFDALNELKSSSQGKSFYAFWEFLMASEMQFELENLITELFQALKDRNIENNDQFLQNMVTYLYEAGHKVCQSNDKMADKLSHIIRDNETSRIDLTIRTIQEIKNILIKISKSSKVPNISLDVDDGLDISIPFERKLTVDLSEYADYDQIPEIKAISIDELGALGKVFGNVAIDRKAIVKNIRGVINEEGQTTLSDIIQKYPLKQGLPELFAYFGVLNQFAHKSVNADKQQHIVFDAEQNKQILIPEIIISR